MENLIELTNAEVKLRPDGILHIHLKEGCEITIEDAQQVLKAMAKLGGGKKLPVLIDAGEFVQVDQDVQEFSASKEGNIYTLADAIAYYSLGQKLLAHFYIKLNNPVVPTRTFDKKSEAITWLKSFIK
jgi:hypothetical protein